MNNVVGDEFDNLLREDCGGFVFFFRILIKSVYLVFFNCNLLGLVWKFFGSYF